MGNKKCRFTCAKGSVLSVPFRAMRQYFPKLAKTFGMFRNFPCYGTIRGENVRHVPFISVPWDSPFQTVSNLPAVDSTFCVPMPYGNLTWAMHLRYNNILYSDEYVVHSLHTYMFNTCRASLVN